MIACPSEETLAGLLADALSTTEQEALARHVEGCASCQGKLARLTNASGSELWQRVENLPPRNDAEREVVRRLKQLWHSATSPPDLAAGTEVFSDREPAIAAMIDAKLHTIPGYEIIEELGHGGMGVVFKARHLALQRIVALKMLRNWAGPGERN